MIFVTVGTHEQPFNRLIKKIDNLVLEGVITEPVIMQTGYSTYVPTHCEWHKMLPYNAMEQYISEARIVITHGGPASFIEVLQKKKIPIVVPRLEKFNEHINNHQNEFVKVVEERMGNIIPVYEIDDLSDTIRNYDKLVLDKKGLEVNHNAQFNKSFEKIINELIQ